MRFVQALAQTLEDLSCPSIRCDIAAKAEIFGPLDDDFDFGALADWLEVDAGNDVPVVCGHAVFSNDDARG